MSELVSPAEVADLCGYHSPEEAAYVETRIRELNRRHRLNERREKYGLPTIDLTPEGEEFDFESLHRAPPASADSPSLEAMGETVESLLADEAGDCDDDPDQYEPKAVMPVAGTFPGGRLLT